MHGLKSGSCRFWQRTDSPPGSNMHGLKSGSCRFWQRTDSPPGSNMLRLAYADSGSACKLAGVQIIPLLTLANQILARTFFRSLVLLCACPAPGKFSRASSAGDRRHLRLNFVNRIVSVAEDCLSPERTFHGCSRWRIKFSLERFSDSYSRPFACPAVGKFSRASSAGDRRHLRLNFVNRIVSVAEDCLSPERTFHGCLLMHFRGCISIYIRDFISAQCVQP
jgi:hypothetical protein